MRAAWILAPLAGLALGSSCILPQAYFEASGGHGGGTGSSTTASSGPGLPMAAAHDISTLLDGPMAAASGNPTQRHLIFAADTWWMLYLVPGGNRISARGSKHFDTWLDNTGDHGNASTIPISLGAVPLDGRFFGVDTERLGAVDVVHVTMTGGIGQPRLHARAVALPAVQNDGLAGLAFDTVAPVVLASTTVKDGATTVITSESPAHILDFSSAQGCDPDGGALSSACVLGFAQTDTGGAWAADAGEITSLDQVFTSPSLTALLALSSGQVEAVWQTDNLLQSSHLEPSKSWQTQPVSDFTSNLENRSWAACAQQNTAQSSVAHVVWWTSDKHFHHRTTTTGSWTTRAEPPDGGLDMVDELFLACSSKRVFAFTIAGPTHNEILGAAWDESPDTWSDWAPVVRGDASAPARCFLSGFDRLVEGHGIGLLWSASCKDPQSPAQIFGALVPVSEP